MIPLDKVHYYAIKIGDYVEVRSAAEPPRKLVSKLKKKIEKTRWLYDHDDRYGDPVYRNEKYKTSVTFAQVFYVGGKVRGVSKYSSFMKITSLTVPKDGMIEISHQNRNLLRKVML